MDYVRWELERQKRVLTALLYDGRPLAEQEIMDTEQANSYGTNLEQKQQKTEKLVKTGFVEQADETFGHASQGIDKRPTRDSRSYASYRMRWVPRTFNSHGGEMREVHQTRNVAASQLTGNVKPDVRGMSRAIQRDARRYDGGFSIY